MVVAFAFGALAGYLVRGGARLGEPLAARAATARPTPAPTTPSTPLAGSYRARVLRVIDGDTVEARVHVWMGQELVTRVRLSGIDAPELNGGCAFERALAEQSRLRLVELAGGREITLVDVGADKYFGRVVGRLITPQGEDAGQRLVSEGLARATKRRSNWC